jgi:DNA mismatch repair protein MSH6
MILDSQALQHLEIFETMEGESGSLFNIVDRTKTKFGKRLMRRWIMSPLTNINQLNERLNAIEDLEEHVLEREKMSQALKKLPDLEKKANKLYHYAIKNTNASKAIYFEDIHVNRLK